VAPTAMAVVHRRELLQLLVDAACPDASNNELNRAKPEAESGKLSHFINRFGCAPLPTSSVGFFSTATFTLTLEGRDAPWPYVEGYLGYRWPRKQSE
jgi:hypothetical protein